MKRYYSFFLILFTFLSFGSQASSSELSNIEKSFAQLYQSTDFNSRITAIILTAEFKQSALNKSLKKLLKTAQGLDRVVILYALARCESDTYIEPFIQTLPETELEIKLLLDIESPRQSFFAAPSFRILTYLGSLALYHDNALKKLKNIDRFADGWQAESLGVLLEAAQKQHLNKP